MSARESANPEVDDARCDAARIKCRPPHRIR
jgi:hypothetical protein